MRIKSTTAFRAYTTMRANQAKATKRFMGSCPYKCVVGEQG
ncbi:hypothetical protein [Citreicoccus inhibens]|nr:hypothetical protein [Citreicoccus inhibens]